jgi:putative copper export protein
MFNGALPAGTLDPANVPLVLARAVWLCALFSATGALAFRALEAGTEAGRSPELRRALSRLIVASLALSCAAWAVWVVLQAASIAGAGSLSAALAALRPVFVRSAFGHCAAMQIGLVVLAWLALALGWGWARFVPAALALGTVTLQVGHLHAWAMTGGVSPLTVAVLLHLWVAALWLGALLPLRLAVRMAPMPVAVAAVGRFSRRAVVLVAILALTALYQATQMFGGIAGLFGATYGWVALAKLLLFVVLLGFAWRNRFRLTPALSGADPAAARAALARSISVETGFGVAVLLVAAVLTALPPGMHVEPTWPFTLRPSDPFTPTDVAVIGVLGVALLLAGAAVALRRRRLPLLALALVMVLLAVPRLGALTQPATPTSFYHSETGFTAASVADGGVLFARNCAACHSGAAAITRTQLAEGDGDLYWVLTAGVPNMPGFAATLDDDSRWHLIDFLRARAAAGTLPTRAPDVGLTCADGSTPQLSDLQGKRVTILFPVRPTAKAKGPCRVTDPDAAAAYGIAIGTAPDRLAGTEMLIDPNGWLLELHWPENPKG